MPIAASQQILGDPRWVSRYAPESPCDRPDHTVVWRYLYHFRLQETNLGVQGDVRVVLYRSAVCHYLSELVQA